MRDAPARLCSAHEQAANRIREDRAVRPPVSYTHLDVYKRQGQKIVDALEAREQGKPVQIVFEARFIAELFGLMKSYEVE